MTDVAAPTSVEWLFKADSWGAKPLAFRRGRMKIPATPLAWFCEG